MQSFKELQVWNKAHRLTLAIYKRTATFPKDELYGLTGQMRRCSISIAANIAEGCGRGGTGDLARFLQIALGSASELEYYVLLAHDLGLLYLEEYEARNRDVTEIKRMLASLIRKIKN
ncbi:MAG TPA: four helix bundle protein [Roseiflexaceae bacterium]